MRKMCFKIKSILLRKHFRKSEIRFYLHISQRQSAHSNDAGSQ